MKVVDLKRVAPVVMPGEPDVSLVDSLEKVLAEARSGELRCFCGIGFDKDGGRVYMLINEHESEFQMLGGLDWLRNQYLRDMDDGEDDDSI